MHEPNRLNCLILTIALCVSFTLPAQTKKPVASVSVPFVGCKSDGQQGPQDAPAGTTKTVRLAPELAQQLAYYKAEEGPGVLAPRGWNCISTYGSNGSTLYIVPGQIDSKLVFSDSWKGLNGPAIQLSLSVGDTSGRFEVAEVIARVFPAYSSFVRQVIAEGIEPASSFPFGPYPGDKLTYRSNKVVEYKTPPNSDGLGTSSMLLKDASPISGVAILVGADNYLYHLSSRLPPKLAAVAAAITRQVERDVAKSGR